MTLLRSALLLSLLPAVAGEARAEAPISFRNDVMPHLVAAGCASGGCHSKPDGQNNFQLSVFGFDPSHDFHEIVRDNRGRRISRSAPEESLLLKKATGTIPHEGGARFSTGDEAYRVLRTWIAQGAKESIPDEPTYTSMSLEGKAATYEKGSRHQLKVTATYSDQSSRDVTQLAEYFSQNQEIATINSNGLIRVQDLSGEGIIVVRYMGHVDIVRITVPSGKTLPEEKFAALPVNNKIDELVYARHRKLGILPSPGATDGDFLRRVSLDITGRLPTLELTRRFLADQRPDKRKHLIDELLQDPNYADHWAVVWGDLIRPNPSRVGVKPVYLLDEWIRDSFRRNKPYDQMVRELITAKGSSHSNGPVAMFRDKRDPVDTSAFVSQIFLGVRLDCAKCHHHPNEKWSQEDYYQLSAFFAQMKRKGQGISAPISGEPEYMWYGGQGSISHPVTGATMVPKPPDGPEMPYDGKTDPREQLAEWMVAKENPFFAKAIVNRMWSHLLGRGIVDPVDDLRVSNPPSNEELLDFLAKDFAANGYDFKHLLRLITNSRTYQMDSRPNEHNVADTQNYSRFLKRRMGAEVLLDAVNDFTGIPDTFSGMPAGTRAVQTWNVKLSSTFLDAFGRPNASEECPCERDRKSSVVQALHLMNSNNLQDKLKNPKGRATVLAKNGASNADVVKELYLGAFCRNPDDAELASAVSFLDTRADARQTAIEDLMWSLINSAEFVFNH
jgi:hypothetical protein